MDVADYMADRREDEERVLGEMKRQLSVIIPGPIKSLYKRRSKVAVRSICR